MWLRAGGLVRWRNVIKRYDRTLPTCFSSRPVSDFFLAGWIHFTMVEHVEQYRQKTGMSCVWEDSPGGDKVSSSVIGSVGPVDVANSPSSSHELIACSITTSIIVTAQRQDALRSIWIISMRNPSVINPRTGMWNQIRRCSHIAPVSLQSSLSCTAVPRTATYWHHGLKSRGCGVVSCTQDWVILQLGDPKA